MVGREVEIDDSHSGLYEYPVGGDCMFLVRLKFTLSLADITNHAPEFWRYTEKVA